MATYRCIYLGYLKPLLETLCSIQAIELVGVGLEMNRPQARVMERFILERGIKYFDAGQIRSNESFDRLLADGVDIAVVGAFGQILDKRILSQPRFGVLNFHPSVLPAYRGGSPIEEQILRGDASGGATLHWMAEGVDAGPIVGSGTFAIGANDDYFAVLNKAVGLGRDLLIELFKRPIESWPRREQDSEATNFALRKKSDGLINWSMEATQIDRIVRALGWRGWPKAVFTGGEIGLTKAKVVEMKTPETPGTVLATAPKAIISCGADAIELTEATISRELILGEVLTSSAPV